MTEAGQLVATLKRQLKAQALTYRDVAQTLQLSEASVKRLFAGGRFTVERVAQIARLLGFTLAELVQEAGTSAPRLQTLTRAQEAQLVSDPKLLLVAVCAFNHWALADMVATYRVGKADCIKRLLVLDRMGILQLLPGDRIRLLAARNFDWLPNGPIRQYFLKQAMGEFLASRFDGADESIDFAHGMLTEAAHAQMQAEVARLRTRLNALHEESAGAPRHAKRGVGLLVAMRNWEPESFVQLRRAPP